MSFPNDALMDKWRNVFQDIKELAKLRQEIAALKKLVADAKWMAQGIAIAPLSAAGYGQITITRENQERAQKFLIHAGIEEEITGEDMVLVRREDLDKALRAFHEGEYPEAADCLMEYNRLKAALGEKL